LDLLDDQTGLGVFHADYHDSGYGEQGKEDFPLRFLLICVFGEEIQTRLDEEQRIDPSFDRSRVHEDSVGGVGKGPSQLFFCREQLGEKSTLPTVEVPSAEHREEGGKRAEGGKEGKQGLLGDCQRVVETAQRSPVDQGFCHVIEIPEQIGYFAGFSLLEEATGTYGGNTR